jgi:hypothetical protein
MMVKVEERDHSVATDTEVFASEASSKKVEEVRMFQGDIPAGQGGRTEERNGVCDGKGGDPRTTNTIEDDVEHVLETDELDDYGIRWFIEDKQNGSDGMRDGYDSQFEYFRVVCVLAHETD